MSVNKSSVDSVIKALYAYVNVDGENRRYLKRQLCTNQCIKYVLGNIINSSSSRTEHETLFSVLRPRDFVELIAGTDEKELFSGAEYIVEGVDIMKDVDEDKVSYLSKLFYKLSYVLLKFHTQQKNKNGEKVKETELRPDRDREAGQRHTHSTFGAGGRAHPKHVVKSPPPPVRKRI